jgi:3-deoxy-D-manno-octulosonic-acid transferase
MSVSYQVYRLLSGGLFFPALAPLYLYSRLTGKFKEGFAQRMGRYSGDVIRRAAKRPRIWIHAVSVGEVRAAMSIRRAVDVLLPHSSVILSTTTDTGQALARKASTSADPCIYAPVDAPFAVGRALRAFRPDLLAVCETEIWPNWLIQAREAGIRAALVNGRISPRSFRRYLRIRPLMAPVLESLQAFSMISDADAVRIRKLGAEPGRVRVHGNAKYDGLLAQASEADRQEMTRLMNLAPGDPVLVAGSVRGAEMKKVLDAFCRIRASLPRAVMVLAPRHLKNAAPFAALAAERGLAVQTRTTLNPPEVKRTAPVVVLDTMGELMAAYGTASAVFCGGSLAPLGGQNLLEPAAWAKPVLYGPSTEDFADAREILESKGGGEAVSDEAHLAERALYYLCHPEEAAAVGKKALAAAAAQTGAGRRHAEEIAALLENSARTAHR